MNNRTLKFCGNPTLETERLILRKFSLMDAYDVYNYAKNKDVAKYVTWEVHKSIDDSREYINWVIKRCEKDEAGEWGIELKSTGKIIGAIGIVQFDAPNSCGTIGYVLSKKMWGFGIMTEAVKRIIRFAFTDMGLNRIEAIHMLDNPASGRVMEKAGMKYEGVLRQRVYAKGKYWDVKQYAIIRNDYFGK